MKNINEFLISQLKLIDNASGYLSIRETEQLLYFSYIWLSAWNEYNSIE